MANLAAPLLPPPPSPRDYHEMSCSWPPVYQIQRAAVAFRGQPASPTGAFAPSWAIPSHVSLPDHLHQTSLRLWKGQDDDVFPSTPSLSQLASGVPYKSRTAKVRAAVQ